MNDSHTPLIFGHRGACGYAPENTLASFELAADLGADGVEFDVQISRDGKLIIHHDRVLGRTEQATGLLANWTFADLRALDVGSWYDARFSGQRMPTPDELVDAVGDRLLLNFELINDSWRLNGVGPALVTLFRRHNLFQRAMISSFNPRALWQVKKLAPQVTIGALWSPNEPWLVRSGLVRRLLRPQALHPRHDLVTPGLVATAHARGQQLNTWTVNDAETARHMIAAGVDMMMGDYPDVLRQALR